MNQPIIMLEKEDSRYELYMKGIKRSNIDDTIVRYEMRCYHIQKGIFGSTASDYKLYEIEKFISDLLLKGYKEVTLETRTFV